MTHRRNWFFEYEAFSSPTKIRIGNGEEMSAHGKVNIEIETFVHNRWIAGTMYDVLFVPQLEQNLFSEKVVAKRREFLDY